MYIHVCVFVHCTCVYVHVYLRVRVRMEECVHVCACMHAGVYFNGNLLFPTPKILPRITRPVSTRIHSDYHFI